MFDIIESTADILETNQSSYKLRFREIIEYEQESFDMDQIEIDEIENEEFIYNIEINSAVSRMCERIFNHWPVMKNIYGSEGEELIAKLAFWTKMKQLDKLAFRGCSAVSIEEFMFALDVLKFFFNPEKPDSRFGKDLLVVFKAMINSLKEIELPKFKLRTNSICEDITLLQEFLDSYRADSGFRDSFLIFKDTLFKKCMSMAQYIALLQRNDHLLCIGPGSIAKSVHANATSYEGRNLSAEVGHGFTDFLAIDMGEGLPEDPQAREEEILRRLKLAYKIRKNSESYEVKDVIKAAAQYAQGDPLNFHVWELKIHNEKPKKKLMQNYFAQTGGYVEKLKIAMDKDAELNFDVNLAHGLVVVTPDGTSITGNISEHVFKARIEEMLKKLDSIATLYDRPHFEGRKSENDIFKKADRVLSPHEKEWLKFQNIGTSILVDESVYNSKVFEVIEEFSLEISTIASGYFISDDGEEIEDEDGLTERILQPIRELTGLDIVAIKRGYVHVRNNGAIWINKGWSEEAKREARENGFNVKVANNNVLPPEHIGESWALTFMFPKVNENLVELLRNKSRRIPNNDCGNELLLLNVDEKDSLMQGKLNLEKVAELRQKCRDIREDIAERSKSTASQNWKPDEFKQQPLQGFNVDYSHYFEA